MALGLLIVVVVAVVAVPVLRFWTLPSEDVTVRNELAQKRQLNGLGSKAVRTVSARNGKGKAQKVSGMVNKGIKQDANKGWKVVFSQAVDDIRDIQFAQALADYKPSVILGAAVSVMKNVTSVEKANSLYAVVSSRASHELISTLIAV